MNRSEHQHTFSDEIVSVPLAVLFLFLEALVMLRGLAEGLEVTHLVIGMMILLVYAFVFSCRVAVTRDELVISYGIGLLQQIYSISDLENLRVEPNNKLLSWIYDPFGSEVVSAGVRMGKRIVITTHNPAALLTAIRSR
jgi:hypothetical protein